MERLKLINPPDDIHTYVPNCIVRRKKRFLKIGCREWSKVFAAGDFTINWVVPWWKIEAMIGCSNQAYFRLPSLSRLTFYFPCRVMRQYGLAQTIPTGDLRRPYEFPVSQELERFDMYWSGRPLWEVIAYKEPPLLSNRVKQWLDGKYQNIIILFF